MSMNKICIYTDGSARPTNPGPGGFGVVVLKNDEIIKLYSEQFKGPVTNNEMEIKAILYAYKNYGVKDSLLPIVYSDSSYCVNTFNEWMYNWASRGWIKSDNKQPKNLELIQEYYDLWKKGYRIDLQKVKGHSTNKWNNLADLLAMGEISSEEIYKQYIKSI